MKTAYREVRKNPVYTALMIVVVTVAMYTTISAFTNTVTTIYQKSILENHLGLDMKSVLHLRYQYTSEKPEFSYVLTEFLEHIRGIDGVEAAGRYLLTSVYFKELENDAGYQHICMEHFKYTDYADYPGLSHIINIDEELLPMVRNGIPAYTQSTDGTTPIYASAVYENVIPIGARLTTAGSETIYEVIGFLPSDWKWLSGDDIIRYPMIDVSGWFVAPFTEKDNSDIMTQLSCLHNTYVLISKKEFSSSVAEKIHEFSVSNDFKAVAVTLEDEFVVYEQEIERMATNRIILSVFVIFMAAGSTITIFTTNALLKKKQYGIFLANGFTLSDIAIMINLEILIIVSISTFIAWIIKYVELWSTGNLFRELMVEAHLRYGIVFIVFLSIVLTGITSIIPTLKIRQFKPCELIGGASHGNDRT